MTIPYTAGECEFRLVDKAIQETKCKTQVLEDFFKQRWALHRALLLYVGFPGEFADLESESLYKKYVPLIDTQCTPHTEGYEKANID